MTIARFPSQIVIEDQDDLTELAVMTLPTDTARCPGRALLVNSRPSTDPQCEGCQRLAAGRAD